MLAVQIHADDAVFVGLAENCFGRTVQGRHNYCLEGGLMVWMRIWEGYRRCLLMMIMTVVKKMRERKKVNFGER